MMTIWKRAAALGLALGLGAFAAPAQAQQLMADRDTIVQILESLECFATDGELAQRAMAAGISRRRLGEALRFMRGEGTIDSGREQGVPVILLRDAGRCGGPRRRQIENPIEDGAASQEALQAVVGYVESRGCIAETFEIEGALLDAGYSRQEILGALQIMGRTGTLQTVRGAGPQGVRLTGTRACP